MKLLMGRHLWVIDAGHGGIDNFGVYTTAPAKMHRFEDGFTVHEGVINRGIAHKLMKGLNNYPVDYRCIYDHAEDTPLPERARLANTLHARYGNCIGISIHCNAGKGSGFEFWTSRGKTLSDDVASVMYRKYLVHFPQHKFRSDWVEDGDPDKEADFYILKATTCPFVLPENLFFDYRKDAEQLVTSRMQQAIADALLDTIIEIEDKRLIPLSHEK
jgi:N-acetylmuramoyl-L-alanine amidase